MSHGTKSVRGNKSFQINLREARTLGQLVRNGIFHLKETQRGSVLSVLLSYSTIIDRCPYLEKERTLILSLWTG